MFSVSYVISWISVLVYGDGAYAYPERPPFWSDSVGLALESKNPKGRILDSLKGLVKPGRPRYDETQLLQLKTCST
ncbi:hypothetical protein EJ04DRAFT_137259 [Polyplosphaeria fusca]|uniref:Uncharacterized protein n=1 Tax=Polyplosphaeria fusca TaxID=682080 RepID=A0A9P4UT61_9PLEO|nr:hypothetical protein EJ04DRAFT_137259 [Polyplosphaeria fusca]